MLTPASVKHAMASTRKQWGADVTIKWTEQTGGEIDAITGSVIGATDSEMSLNVQAPFHLISHGNRLEVIQHNEVEIGDAVLDLPPDIDLDGKENVRFIVNGQTWIQKAVGQRLTQAWDVTIGGQKLNRPMLITQTR